MKSFDEQKEIVSNTKKIPHKDPQNKSMEKDYVPLIEVRELSKYFWMENRRIDVLEGLSVTLRQSESVAIIGASGAGKSTLLQILGTLDVPNSGEMKVLGQNVFAMNEDELATFRNQHIGFVFQAHYLLPEFSAIENVMMPAFIQRLPKQVAKERAEELLEWVGLSERRSHRPGELSGGERQRVALCRALVMRPPILLADEPTGNLDANTAEGIHDLLLALNKDWNVTPIIVTHNISLAHKMQICLTLKSGRLEQLETRLELQEKEDIV